MEHPLLKAYILNNHFGELLGMDFKVTAPGTVEYRMKIEKKHLATPHAAHGGAIASLADAALGVAGLSAVLPENKVVSTVEYKINFLGPVFPGNELLATAKVESKGKRLLIVSCDIRSLPDGNIIAKALGTFNAYPAEKAGYRI